MKFCSGTPLNMINISNAFQVHRVVAHPIVDSNSQYFPFTKNIVHNFSGSTEKIVRSKKM